MAENGHGESDETGRSTQEEKQEKRRSAFPHREGRLEEAQRVIRETEARFRGLVANLPGLIYRCSYSKPRRMLYMSDGFEELTGYRIEEFEEQGLSYDDLIVRGDVEGFRQAVQRGVGKYTSYEAEYRLRRKDGTVCWVLDRGQAQYDDDGSVRWLDGMAFDVTARRQDEQKLALLEQAVQHVDESVFITDAVWEEERGPRILFVNDAFEAMTGYTTDEVVGKTPRILEGPDTGREELRRLREALRNGDVFRGEMINYRKDGRPVSLEWTVGPASNRAGQVTHYVAVQREVSQEKQLTLRMHLLKKVMDQTRDAVIITRPYSEQDARRVQVAYVNEAFTDMTGYTRFDVMDREPSLLFGSETDPQAVEEITTAFAAERPSSVEMEIHRKDDSSFWVEFSSAPVFDEKGRIRYWVTVQRDVTETRRLGAERAARKRAEEMVRAKDAFLNSMTHEIRTPLASILGFADVLSDEVPEGQQDFVQVIKESGERLLSTLNHVLDLARYDSDNLTVELEPIDMGASVREVVKMLRPLASQKGLALEFDTPSHPVVAPLDRRCFERIVTNLVSNAVKFTEEGGVWITVGTERDRAQLIVRDTGIGISEAFMPRLFDEFEQEEETRASQPEGSGLGLAITKRLVEAMEGDIRVESTKGEGTTFTVSFDREQVAPQQQEQGPARILVVEGNERTRTLLTHLLESHWQVDAVDSYPAALDHVRTQPYALVVVGLEPGREHASIDLVNELRSGTAHADTPVVALTVVDEPIIRKRLLKAGFDACVSRPFNNQSFVELVNDLLTG